ncbi:MAG: VWA domain-containing protein [Thermomicrobiales bacterium]|nr:VWA domain-containing protein [Thermomicrobiales bacterium]
MSFDYSFYPRNRYSRWDGTQQIDGLTADDIMDAISDDMFAQGDLQSALQRLFNQGLNKQDSTQMPGIRQLMERLKAMRQRELNRYDLGSVLDDLKQRLEEIQQLERDGIEQRLDQSRQQTQQPENSTESSDGKDKASETGEQSQQSTGEQDKSETGDADDNERLQRLLESMAQKKLDALDNLPPDPAGQIKALTEYEFMDQRAREKFQELLEQLQQQMLQQTFQGMQQSLQNMTPESMQEMQQMLSELNDMLEERANGGQPDFERFMHRWGHYFGNDIKSLDELMDHMAQQMAAMQSLMNSMSQEQRAELWNAMQAVMNDPGMQQQMERLSENLSQMMGPNPYADQYRFRGDEDLSLDQALRLMDRLHDMDEMSEQLRGVRDWRDLEDVDDQKIRELLGDEFQHDLDQLRQLTQLLEDAGYIKKGRRGWEMTAQGVRKIGQKALTDIFQHLKRDRFGQHQIDHTGQGGERTDTSKPYEFGDPFLLDLPKTVMNAVWRDGTGAPVHLAAEDFEVYRTEQITQSSTVLMVDMSRSMLYNGCFAAAKKVALALDSLIRGQFPRDNLYVLGFSYVATRLDPATLPSISWDEYNYGTNMQHGLMMARQLLARHKGGNKQVIVITDGEPTAHFEDGQVRFSYPPTYQTLQETLKEVMRCTRENVTINTFMLEHSPYMAGFVSEMAKINKGRAFFATPDRLGEYILVDYVANKRTARHV